MDDALRKGITYLICMFDTYADILNLENRLYGHDITNHMVTYYAYMNRNPHWCDLVCREKDFVTIIFLFLFIGKESYHIVCYHTTVKM